MGSPHTMRNLVVCLLAICMLGLVAGGTLNGWEETSHLVKRSPGGGGGYGGWAVGYRGGKTSGGWGRKRGGYSRGRSGGYGRKRGSWNRGYSSGGHRGYRGGRGKSSGGYRSKGGYSGYSRHG